MTDEEDWAQLEAEAEADIRAGRLYDIVGDEITPNQDWPLDDPIQPIGWHREAGKWVKDEEEDDGNR